VSALEQVSASAGYVHVDKAACPEPRLTLGETTLKWYDIAPDEAPVPLVIRALARRNLRDAAKAGVLGDLGEFGFVILHRCGEDFYFLLVSTWRNDNELWETVWAKAGDADVSFHSWSVETEHRPTFCVWELGAVAHEREAWTRYVRSARDAPARRAYLQDTYTGAV
jgi:hypothetical protein